MNNVSTIGLFEDRRDAEQARERLVASGFQRDDIRVTTNKTDLNSVLNLPQNDKAFYSSFLDRDGILVIVQAPANRINEAAQILTNAEMGAVNADERNEEYRSQGYTKAKLRDFNDKDIVLPVIEEQLKVGKREVERGRMRIYSEVEEVPVEEQVKLRKEEVHVDRRPVNRAADSDDIDNLPTGSFEVRSTTEEPVVSKNARVVEEVVISKDTSERTETVRDTVKRSDVEVDKVDAERAVGETDDYGRYQDRFRTYYNSSLKSSGMSYNDYDPAFRYGHSLATTNQLRGRDWNTIEPQARQRWEERNPSTWDRFKGAVQHAWNTVTNDRDNRR